MGTHRLKFLEQPGKNINSKAHIALKTYSEIAINNVKYTVISPECTTFRQVDDEINSLISELEMIRKSAKIFFKDR